MTINDPLGLLLWMAIMGFVVYLSVWTVKDRNKEKVEDYEPF